MPGFNRPERGKVGAIPDPDWHVSLMIRAKLNLAAEATSKGTPSACLVVGVLT